jgi:hypothetical protein
VNPVSSGEEKHSAVRLPKSIPGALCMILVNNAEVASERKFKNDWENFQVFSPRGSMCFCTLANFLLRLIFVSAATQTPVFQGNDCMNEIQYEAPPAESSELPSSDQKQMLMLKTPTDVSEEWNLLPSELYGCLCHKPTSCMSVLERRLSVVHSTQDL